MSSPEPAVSEARYTWGGDEFLFVEVAESMSLAANFRVCPSPRSFRPCSCPASWTSVPPTPRCW